MATEFKECSLFLDVAVVVAVAISVATVTNAAVTKTEATRIFGLRIWTPFDVGGR